MLPLTLMLDLPFEASRLYGLTMGQGILYIRIFDAYKASYGVEDAEYAISQLAQTTMRSEIGQLTLDHVLKERAALNVNITKAINEAAEDWGVKCLRYEIRDIHAPEPVLQVQLRFVGVAIHLLTVSFRPCTVKSRPNAPSVPRSLTLRVTARAPSTSLKARRPR